MPLRVMQVIGSKGGGGAESFFVRFTQALQASGANVLAIAPPNSRIAAELGGSVPLQPVAMRGVWDIFSSWAIRRAIRRFQPDIVQTWMGRATRLVHLPPSRRPVHVARLGGYYDLKGYRHAHAWIGNTQGICDYLVREGLPAERVFHIGNFIEPVARPSQEALAPLRAHWRIPPDAAVLFAAGRLHPNKGYADLLAAFARLPQEIDGKPLRLLLAGDGPLKEALHAQARQFGIQPRVTWLGWQNDLAPFFALADLFVCPSVHEPLGNVILEAWAHGVPLVTTATAGALELVTPGVNGMLVPCRDAPALATAMRDLLQVDAATREALASAGRAALRASHGKDAVIGAYLDLYRKLLGTCAA